MYRQRVQKQGKGAGGNAIKSCPNTRGAKRTWAVGKIKAVPSKSMSKCGIAIKRKI